MSKDKFSSLRQFKPKVNPKVIRSDFTSLKQSETLKQRHAEGVKFFSEPHSEESRKKMSASQKRRYEDNPELREKQSQDQKKRFQDPEQKQKFIEQMNRPEVRKKISDANKGRIPSNKISKEVWIERFISVHGDRYDYSKFDVDNEIIICSIHGEFRQRKKDHWYGRGCKKCSWGMK